MELFYLDGLSEQEVAAEVGIARSAVKSRLHKARRKLSTQLRNERRPVMAQLSLVDVEVVDVHKSRGRTRRNEDPCRGPRERGGQRSLPIFVGEPEGRGRPAP